MRALGRSLSVLLALSSWSCATAHRPATVSIAIVNLEYVPAEATARVGDIVEWSNRDVLDHTATATAGGWRAEIPAGQTRTIVMQNAGVFDYYCEYHPNMKAKLVVTK